MAAPPPKRLNEPTSQFTIRLPDSVAARADRLLDPALIAQLPPNLHRVLISRVAVFRECLLQGLADFESDLGLSPLGAAPEPKPASKPKGKGRKAG